MASISLLGLAIAVLLILSTSAFLRILYIHPSFNFNKKPRKNAKTPSHIVIVLGSGGHTAEMMSLLRGLDLTRYIHRTYIVSSGDNFSAGKAQDIEKKLQLKHGIETTSKPGEISRVTGVWDVKIVPRARKIHQPLYTAPFSSLWCLIGCLRALRDAARTNHANPGQYPDVVITNGPATAVILLFAGYVLKFFDFAEAGQLRTIYVESWARVKSLSLSGKVLLHLGMCDSFLVQWQALAEVINGKDQGSKERVKWMGFLVE